MPAFGISADGSTIVGLGTTDFGREAFLWNQAAGMRRMQDILVDDFGLDLTGWTLESANGISADGTVSAAHRTRKEATACESLRRRRRRIGGQTLES